MFDLIVKNGLIVIPGFGVMRGDVGIRHAKIAALGELTDSGSVTVDAAGDYVLPGIIDPHVHLRVTSESLEQVQSDTQAALVSGITTIGVYLGSPWTGLPLDSSYALVVSDWIDKLGKASNVDFMIHLALFHRTQQQEIGDLIKTYGVTSFKVYMSGIPGLLDAVDDGFILNTMTILAEHHGLLAIHAENEAIIAQATKKARLQYPDGTLHEWATTRPPIAEEEALRRMALLAQYSGCRTYLVHVSSARSVDALREIKYDNHFIIAETTSPYLSLPIDSPGGLKGKMVPPIRGDADALWAAIEAGTIDCVGTDNTSKLLSEKNLAGGLWGATAGYPVLATHLPALLTAGTCQRDIAIERIIDVATRRPAQSFGIYPQKGTLLPGSDADIVIVNLTHPRMVSPKDWLSYTDWSPYEGIPLSGWPRVTIKGGKIVACDGRIVGQPSGQYLSRLPCY
jgi:dihydropyrimidinase